MNNVTTYKAGDKIKILCHNYQTKKDESITKQPEEVF